MALVPIHRFFSLNGEIKPNKDFVASENEGGIYEVLRVTDGIPVFLEEHLERFYRSAELAGKTIRFSPLKIRSFLQKLITVNQADYGNILISCKINLKAFFITHLYPDADQYQNGVECGLLNAERLNPNAKVFQTLVRVQANEMMAQKGFYEVLLVDHDEMITEGSRSNIFFVNKDQIVTPSADKVLLGITRQKTIACAKALNIQIEETNITLGQLDQFEAVFLTGTSPKILPVSKIADYRFNVKNELMRKLMLKYDEMIWDYVKVKKKEYPSDEAPKG